MKIVIQKCPTCGSDFSFELRPDRPRKFCSHICALKRAPTMTDEERFWSLVQKGGSDECWPWLAGCVSFGYGSFQADGKFIGAHQFSWSLKNGKIPEGKCVLHSCDNPPCCNPDHLFLGTKQDNHDDMVSKGRQRKATGDAWREAHAGTVPRGEKGGRALLTENAVIQIRKRANDGETIASLARELTMSEGAIRAVVKRRTWKHVP